MARRRKKKLNKRVAILLGSIGALVIALVGVTVFSSSVMNKLFPKDPATLMEQANKAAEEGDRKAADKAFNMALGYAADQRSPKMPEYYVEAAKFNQKWAIEGTGLTETQRRERFRKAIALARKALLLDATYAPAQEFLADTFWDLNVGSRTQQGRDWNAYIKEADALIKLKPDDSQAYYRRAVARAEMVSYESPGEDARLAREDFDKAIKLDPNEPKYWTGLIHFMNRIPGKEADIEGTFKKAIAANPDDSGLLINFAGFLRKEKRPEDALKQLDVAVQKDPVLGNIALADYYNANKEKPKALSALDKAIQADPLDIRAYVGKVAMLGAEKKNTEALGGYRQWARRAEEGAAGDPARRRREDQETLGRHGTHLSQGQRPSGHGGDGTQRPERPGAKEAPQTGRRMLSVAGCLQDLRPDALAAYRPNGCGRGQDR